ncbi:pyrimidine reductase family protein [Amycolatopsis sp. PS_44_ISF1]|uniref:pyrimidine reductase family protein n=1 Tax=Amycolatopsis sp. PS_44_ISF1 TaxID=2974917 RepID=UPI0028E017E4|nr:pyrimidine reductase family protein [Amycolatopsis sp. PS_44_ISF1]MDT8914497.1 pyrimidine reductase family protein [Amycolatopsis sp. PS_44_ISF1]
MDLLLPPSTDDFTANDLEELYAYPDHPARPWIRVNFVSSVDGAVTVDGRSQQLSGKADRRVYELNRDLADVVLVGAGTAIAEGYAAVRGHELDSARRSRHRLSPALPIAVVSNRCSIPADSPLFEDAEAPTLILTCEKAPAERKAALRAAGAVVLECGGDQVEPAELPAALDGLGLRRVNCEGGPGLFATLIAADLVDELCLTVEPVLVAGEAGRIASGAQPKVPRSLDLVSLVHADGSLLLRYHRRR